jgi:hypothetical protein
MKDQLTVETIEKALEKRSENKKRDEMKASIMEEIKPLMFDEFKAELERYAENARGTCVYSIGLLGVTPAYASAVLT